MRDALVAALVSCSDSAVKSESRRFLAGLSYDELMFIADFFGACILDSAQQCFCSRAQLARRIAEFQSARSRRPEWSEDQDHKMIVLLEYLSRGGARRLSMAAAGRA